MPKKTINLGTREKLMAATSRQIESWNLTQEEAAARLGISQPRLNDLLRDRVANFSLDALVLLASRAGLHVSLEATSVSAGAPELGTPALVEIKNPKAKQVRGRKRRLLDQ